MLIDRRLRIAVGSIFQETNHFAAIRTDLKLFRNSFLLEGQPLFSLASTDCEVGGILKVCEEEAVEVVPLLAARSVSGGPLTAACYAYLKQGLLERLRSAGPVDGVVLAMHGAMGVEGEDDPEGEILAEIRTFLNPDVPVVMTLDLHAHVTDRMVAHATGLISFRHYPHDDTYTTGERGARLLIRILRDGVRPAMAVAKVPVLVAGCEGTTFGQAPMAEMVARGEQLEADPRVLSVSVVHVQPYLDVEAMGCGGIVITDGDAELAETLARSFAAEFWEKRARFMPEILSVAEAVSRGRAVEGGPVLLVDTADCAGGGAAGDSVALLRELLALGISEPACLMVVDPQAAEACANAGIGSTVTLGLGYGVDPTWGSPLQVSGTVALLSDGRFRYTGGAYGGTYGAMGLTALLRVGSIAVLITSNPTYDWADEQYRAVGIDPSQYKFVGVKNPMNYRLAYRNTMKASFLVDTPGPTPAHVLNLPFRKMKRPCYPFDLEIPALEPHVAVRFPAAHGTEV
jgi:microcystin degradation protein MlrC